MNVPSNPEERTGWDKAMAALRDSSRFWEFMETHRLGQDGGEFMVEANNCCADYLAAIVEEG